MNIQIDQNMPKVPANHGELGPIGTTTKYNAEHTRGMDSFSLDISDHVKDNNAYGGQGKTTEDVMAQIGATDVTTMQNYMTVMSNTLSGEAYEELMEDGCKVNEMPVGETVTVVDEIKATMAEAGIIIEGYNDDLDSAKLKEITGSAVYAQAILNSFEKYGVEDTRQNVSDVTKELEKVSEITQLSDQTKKYMLVNELSITSDHLFKAVYSSGTAEIKNGQGYFLEQSGGYFGKKADTLNGEQLEGQISKIAQAAGLSYSEEIKEEAAWIVEQGILLTPESLSSLHKMNQMTFPMEMTALSDVFARAISDGIRPREADLTEKESLLEKAVRVKKDVFEELTVESEKGSITAKRQLEEVRLHMTVNANLQLLKRGIQIDTMPIEKTIEALKAQEEAFGKMLFGETEKPAESFQMWQESDLKIAQLRMMPASLVGVISQESSFTIKLAYETGTVLQNQYKAAGETYEALMTAPRGDLGDSITKAFRNVDSILQDLDLDLTEENQRAVRILGYNQMEISEKAVLEVKAADQSLKEMIEKLTPEKTLQLIRDGMNPLETSMEDLRKYFDAQETGFVEQAEKYSKFLYHLEKNNEITQEEREAYIGIYRMLRQIEKSDGAAVGAIVHNGQEMSFSNLLSAVRTKKKGYVDQSVTSETGALKDSVSYKNSISDQINEYFDAFSIKEEEKEYQRELIDQMREALSVSEETVVSLLEKGMEITPDYLMAAKELTKNRGKLYKDLESFDRDETFSKLSADLIEGFEDEESTKQAFEEVIVNSREILENTMDQEGIGRIDLKSMVICHKQLSLAARLAKDEHYEVPVKINGELTSVSVEIVHNKDSKGEVSISFETETYGKISGKFVMQKSDRVSGFVMTNKKESVSVLQQKNEELCENILKESGKNADVTYAWQQKEISVNRIQNKDKDVSTKDLYQIAKGVLKAFAEKPSFA